MNRARQSLLTYTELTYPKYKANWHHELIIDYLESVAAGDIRRLMILVPPRYGKSELSSIRFPAWYLGNNPDKKVILASYNDRFALHFGKHAEPLPVGYARDGIPRRARQEGFILGLFMGAR